MGLINFGILIIINAAFCFPFSTGIFLFYNFAGVEIKTSKAVLRWVVFLTLMGFSMWFFFIIFCTFSLSAITHTYQKGTI